MNGKQHSQAEYISLQLMEIESFRLSLSYQSEEVVSFNEAAMLWISEGYADRFRAGYESKREQLAPAQA